ncbi:MAG: calcium-binding protein [Pseudomonadales bacterium]|jgi:CRP-like cAMP-binding protein|uniref:cyclic nucleotide-binding domain-containing protein n=1 Tax=unclassified Ketobacter TaxID=2639109 RepID=UPI000C8F38EF|nr:MULTISPECIES: cyclic nucleotide-binding domain-containing protein [unclassified Ketobacter]MAQ24155.1 calcium-binding protein [Pseudomonadales bacterium]MEC8814067.1 cyclic nucleotide-binding domain-containing protein [Pseudomonadota bacterium]HAG94482.1 calcium-binding protein [Gammaproteobacteria bacterium]RLT87628.1 MAG: calcium-binding protein [Ketobacter sp. GenoA1]RLT92956.1 MAG: calcium-binding protein [Ketobacter sp.]|tara:strand:+ start:462 stop:1490 length:1029 start_codon:yes stop_codon:yes gene_type:complete
MAELAPPLDEDAIKQLVPFNELLRHQFQEALKCCELLTLPPRKKLFKRGERDAYWYYLLKGSVDLLDEDFNITSFSADDPECRRALDNRPPHRFSSITTSDCEILKVDKNRLDLAITWEQAGDYRVEESDDNDVDWMSALLESDVFAKVPPANIQRLFTAFKNEERALGDVVVAEGDPGNLFYVIEHGSALVSKRSENGVEQVARLGPGQFFGEEALIGETTRNATVTMETDGALMYLEKDEFKSLLEQPVMNRITEQDLDAMQADSTALVLLDVRLSGEFKHFHRENSINIPLNKLRQRCDNLDRSACYVVVDNAGPRAELGAYLLVKAGLQAYLLKSDSE